MRYLILVVLIIVNLLVQDVFCQQEGKFIQEAERERQLMEIMKQQEQMEQQNKEIMKKIEEQRVREQEKKESQKKMIELPFEEISVKEIKELKKKSLEYQEALQSPPKVHKGKRRILPYSTEPQQIATAVGYATIIQVPFNIRRKEGEAGYIVGDMENFNVILIGKDKLSIFPRKPFWSSNLIIFSENDNDPPVLIYLKEEFDKGNADYYVEIKSGGFSLEAEDLFDIVTKESFKDVGMNHARNLRCHVPKENYLFKICELSNPSEKVVAFKDELDCLAGCGTWLKGRGLTITEAVKGMKIVMCESKESKYAMRNCYEYVP